MSGVFGGGGGGGGGLTDGDKGDVIVGGGGATLTLDPTALASIAAEYPLDLDQITDPAVLRIRGFTIPHMESVLDGVAAVSTGATETSLVATGWTPVAGQIAEGDIIRMTAWGTYLNNSGGGIQSDYRVRVGGLAGAVVVVHRIPNTLAASASFRYWRCDTLLLVGAAGASEYSSTLKVSPPAATGTNDELSNTRSGSSAAIDFAGSALEWVPTVNLGTAGTANMTPVAVLVEHQQARP
jgi:hypothetical protein